MKVARISPGPTAGADSFAGPGNLRSGMFVLPDHAGGADEQDTVDDAAVGDLVDAAVVLPESFLIDGEDLPTGPHREGAAEDDNAATAA